MVPSRPWFLKLTWVNGNGMKTYTSYYFLVRDFPHPPIGFSPFAYTNIGQSAIQRNNKLLPTSWTLGPDYKNILLIRQKKEKARTTEKTWYDHPAREYSFAPGDQVIVLQPAGKDKLSAEWQGPYTFLKKFCQCCTDWHDPQMTMTYAIPHEYAQELRRTVTGSQDSHCLANNVNVKMTSWLPWTAMVIVHQKSSPSWMNNKCSSSNIAIAMQSVSRQHLAKCLTSNTLSK